MSFGRTFLYHADCPDGQVFDNEASFQDAIKSGWVEAPWLTDKQNAMVDSLKQYQQKAVAAPRGRPAGKVALGTRSSKEA